jgi:hypothetical protein
MITTDKIIRIPSALNNPKYRGMHLLMVKGKVLASGTWKQISPKIDQVARSGNIPELAYIPKADILILSIK